MSVGENKTTYIDCVDCLVGWDRDRKLRLIEEDDEFGPDFNWLAEPHRVRFHLPAELHPDKLDKRRPIKVYLSLPGTAA